MRQQLFPKKKKEKKNKNSQPDSRLSLSSVHSGELLLGEYQSDVPLQIVSCHSWITICFNLLVSKMDADTNMEPL